MSRRGQYQCRKSGQGGARSSRGPLNMNRPTGILIKVHNEGGVTQALRLYGPEILPRGERSPGRWLEAAWVHDQSFPAELTGRRLEYRLLRLTPRQSGKRESTFQFDVGQGTQDLGFRAETPILFTVRE